MKGRPCFSGKAMKISFIVRLTTEQKAKLKALGGSAWIRKQIEAATKNPA
jgi:hypothetical protein